MACSSGTPHSDVHYLDRPRLHSHRRPRALVSNCPDAAGRRPNRAIPFGPGRAAGRLPRCSIEIQRRQSSFVSFQCPHFLTGLGIARVPEKSIRNGGPAEFAVVDGASRTAGIDLLPAKSTRSGGPAEFAVVAGVGWTAGIDRLPVKSIRKGGPVPPACPVVDRC